ncbi:SURF1 family protein [mine drainage metagenome]|uniref:SURF1 family protein n=1 Tax=mine drainage metagenome TaxID=410659 RepID=A0A1J5QW36_9ZZZZ
MPPESPVPGPEQVWPAPTSFARAAVRPRMIALLLILLAAAGVCGRLGVWQLDRAKERGAQNARAVQAARESTTPVPLGAVLAPQTRFTAEMVGRRVAVTGTFDASGQLLVRDRTRDGRTGFLVLTPLRVQESTSTGASTNAVLPVVRGWVPSADVGATVLAPPVGTVHVTGFLQASEAAGSIDDATAQTDAISSAQLVNRWGGPIYSGYLVVSQLVPAQSVDVLALQPPTVQGAGLNLQNLAYAAQWWIFGGFAIFFWTRMVRDEADGVRGPRAAVDATADRVGAGAP